MEIEIFNLERTQSLWENTVEYNLTETGKSRKTEYMQAVQNNTLFSSVQNGDY